MYIQYVHAKREGSEMIEIKGVSKRLENFELENIHMELPEGYIMGVIGPNGSGKTTLINLILGLYKAEKGEISVFGLNYKEDEKAIHEEIGYVLQERLFEDYLTLEENGNQYGKYYEKYKAEKFLELLDRFNLEPTKRYKTLSKGQELKFQFAFAMAHNPKLLILDEPTGNFDPDFREQFLAILKDYIADGRHSVLLATHITDDLDRMADYITYLENGKQLFCMDIESLHDTYRLVTGEAYKLRLLPKEDVIYMEEGAYTARALIRYYAGRLYDKEITLTLPTMEELMYYITKRQKNVAV